MNLAQVTSFALRTQTGNTALDAARLLDLLPVGVCVCDADGLIQSCNEKACQIWGLSRVPVAQRFCGAYKIFDPYGNFLPHDASPVAQCLASRSPVENVDLIFERPDSTASYVRVTAMPVKDDADKLIAVINCFTEVGDLKLTEWHLIKQAHTIEDYIENAAIALHWVDQKGIIKWANQAELDMLGYDRDEYIGHHISEFHLHNHKIEDIMRRLDANETLHQYESELICKDGSIRNVKITSNVFREDGKFVHSRCFTIDVTESQKVYTALQESEHRYRQLIDGLPTAVYTCDSRGYIDMYNRAAVDLWGREPQLNTDLWCGSWKIYTPEGSPLPLDECPMAICLTEAREVYGEQIVIERPDGTRRHVLPYPKPLFDSKGNLTGALNMLVDITRLKMAEQAVRESEERFRTVANTAPVLIWMGNTVKDRFFFNDSWTAYTGKTEAELTGRAWMRYIHPDDLPYLSEVCDRSFADRTEYDIRYRLLRRDGEYRWVHSHGIPRFGPHGDFVGYIGTIVDIHEQKIRKQELKKYVLERTMELSVANEQLEKSNRELEQFAYIASHDLQEPLRKIRTFGRLLAQRYQHKIDPNGLHLIERMESAADRMATLIDDVLGHSRITGSAAKEPVDVAREVRIVLMDMDTLIKDKQADIRIGELYTVHGYATQIRQLFQNLVGNALKFCKTDRRPVITISSKLVTGGESTFKVREKEVDRLFQLIEVTDNGIGFEQKYSEKIFQIFQRLHGRGQYSGSGIGLSVVAKVAYIHEGYVRALGKPDQGATFQVLLPVYEPASENSRNSSRS
ncbi:PAS domain S-box protein [Dyadobacter sp. 676]|uniref:histidine kinase n=1 Tax=Dyadobacter sp. 676 TaxID=3088362 RepID=A0AAU8FG42_9BACT